MPVCGFFEATYDSAAPTVDVTWEASTIPRGPRDGRPVTCHVRRPENGRRRLTTRPWRHAVTAVSVVSVAPVKVLIVADQPRSASPLQVLFDCTTSDAERATTPNGTLDLSASDDIGVVVQDMNVTFTHHDTTGRQRRPPSSASLRSLDAEPAGRGPHRRGSSDRGPARQGGVPETMRSPGTRTSGSNRPEAVLWLGLSRRTSASGPRARAAAPASRPYRSVAA